MDVVEFRPEPSQYAWTFGGAAPIREIEPGTVLRLWCDDAFGGAIRTVSDLASAKLDPRFLNPQTGPFAVRGAEPGDTLVLHLVDLTPARDWGASTLVPFFGGLTGTDRTALLADPLPERTWIYELDRARGTVTFVAHQGEFSLDLPIDPMLGTVGVAPANREVRSSLTPDAFGGNMDTPEMRAGATCYLPVNVAGRDLLGRRRPLPSGRGRVLRYRRRGRHGRHAHRRPGQGLAARAPLWPRIENDDDIIVVGSSRPLEDAWRISQVEHDRLARRAVRARPPRRLPAAHPGQSLTPLANVVDTNYSAVTKVSKTLVPGLRPLDGLHARPARPRHLPDVEEPRWTSSSTAGPRSSPAAAEGHRTGGGRGARRRGRDGVVLRARRRTACAPRRRSCAAPDTTCTARRSTSPTATRSRAWVRESAAQRGGIDVVVANVSALAIPSTEENWAASFEADRHARDRAPRRGGPARTRGAATRARSSTISSVSGREIDFAAGPYGTFKGALVHYTQGLAYELAGRASGPTPSPPATSTSPGGVWESIEQNDPDLYGHALGLNPTGRMAHAAGGGAGGDVPGQPRAPRSSAAPTSSSTGR